MTPIERAEAKLTRLDLCLPSRDRRWAARAVFESIDPGELARVIESVDLYSAGVETMHHDMARAVKARLLKEET